MKRKLFQKGKNGDEKTSKVSNSRSMCLENGEGKKEEKR